jgi:SAM-dependent methyltransferase
VRELRDIRGLKYPDDYVVRWFFKRGLQARPGRMLELGCGVGNNLALPLGYDWDVVGIDLSAAALTDARHNLGEAAALIQADLSEGLPPTLLGPFRAVMIPNLLCYLTTSQAGTLLDHLRPRLAAGAEVFVRTRLVDDYRYGRGVLMGPKTFRLDTPETGEDGLVNRFWDEDELVALLAERLGLIDPVVLRCRFDNLQSGRSIPNNSDVIVWGNARHA